MHGVKTGAQTCPTCFRSFRGTQGQGPANDRFLQPLLLHCGHTFCQGCITKQVKVLKTSVACPTCQVVTRMPQGETSVVQLPANYYVLGLSSWNSKHVVDMFDKKTVSQSPANLTYHEVQLQGGADLCGSCHRVLASCDCKQCENAKYCQPCYNRVHRGSRSLMNHNAVPVSTSKGRGGCKEHEGREYEFFCQEDQVPICALCALMGTHKGHDITHLADQDKEAFQELRPTLETAKDALKQQYYALQMTKEAKRDIGKDMVQVADLVKASFSRLHSELQLREHKLLDQIVTISAQQQKYLISMLTNIEGNISIMESAMVEAMMTLEDKSELPSNVTSLVHLLKSSKDLPCHVVVPDSPQPVSQFMYNSDVVKSMITFGAVDISSEPRLQLKTADDLPDDWTPPEINEDVLASSTIHTFKANLLKEKESSQAKGVSVKQEPLSPRSLKDGSPGGKYSRQNSGGTVKQEPLSPRTLNDLSPGGKYSRQNSGAGVAASPQLRKNEPTPRREKPKDKSTKLKRINATPKGVLKKELVRVTHIRNPCCFYIQRESDQPQLSNMMVGINRECKLVPEHNRLPNDLSEGALMACLYETDKTWYRARIKSVATTNPDIPRPKTPSETSLLSSTPTLEQETPENASDKETPSEGGTKDDTMSDVKSEGRSEASSEVRQDVLLEVINAQVKAEVKSKVKVEEPKVEVMYVDYGNKEWVSLSKLCRLKPKHENIPDLAVCCSLTDIVPTRKSGRWSMEGVKSFAKMVGDKPVHMSILGHSGATLYVDLHKLPIQEVENDMPISLRDALVFLELACFVSPESVPEACPSRGTPLKFIPADLPALGEEILATVSHFQDPLCFCVQEIGADSEYLLKMTKDLQETYYKKVDDRWNILCPKVGSICVAKFSEDRQWSRAEIVALPGKQLVDVLYVDYGNYERLHCSELRKIPKKFLKLSIQALPCSLVDVGPKDPELGWSTEETKGFGDIILTKALRATVKGINKGRLSVILMEDRQGREININALLVQKGFGQSTGPGSVSAAIIFEMPHLDISDDDTLQNQDASFSDPDTDTQPDTPPHIPKTNGVVVEKRISPSPIRSNTLSSKARSQYTAVHVSHVESPACLFIQLSTAGIDGLDSLLESMTLNYQHTEMEEGDTLWQEGDLCSALYVKEGAWCRGRVKTVLPDNNAVVLFTDYGNTEVVSLSNIRSLVGKFQKDPPFAIQCHLSEVMPGANKWTKTACEFLANTLSDLECVIVKKGELLNGSLPIDLLYERSIEEKVQEESVDDFGSISKLLILRGHALPAKPAPFKSVTNSAETLSPQSHPAESDAPLGLETQENPAEKTHQSFTIETNTEASSINQADTDGVVLTDEDEVPRYLARPLPTSGRLDIVITFVSNDGIISGLEASEVSTFRSVMEQLEVANAVKQTPPTPESLRPGQAVCARYQEDGLWYRASIIRVNQDTAMVRYVDFGNTEEVAINSIHTKPFMIDMPQQSRDCVLIGLRPKAPQNTWPTSTIVFLLNNLLEKPCTALIKSLCSERDPLKVDLLLPNGQSISSLILAQGLAETDDLNEMDSHNPRKDDDDVTMTTTNQLIERSSNGCMAGPDVKYQPMTLPGIGVDFAVSVTHIDQPDLMFICPWAEEPHLKDATQAEMYRQLVKLQSICEGLNEMASSLPGVVEPKPGLCCCSMYQVNQQWYRTVVSQVKAAEKLCEVRYVDFGTTDWVSFDGLRQIPLKFTNLPMQARQCKLIGLKPPPPSANEGATLPDSDWPGTSVDKMLELVSNKKLIASVQDDSTVPGILLYNVTDEQDQVDIGTPQTTRLVHLALIEAGLAQLADSS
ncbi:RING finger protein 17-like isoform X2 [Asterias amurensis]